MITGIHRTCGLTPLCSGRDCVKSHWPSYTGLYQRLGGHVTGAVGAGGTTWASLARLDHQVCVPSPTTSSTDQGGRRDDFHPPGFDVRGSTLRTTTADVHVLNYTPNRWGCPGQPRWPRSSSTRLCAASGRRSPSSRQSRPLPTQTLVSQKVFIQSFCKRQFPHKSVNSSFIITSINDKLTNLCGN